MKKVDPVILALRASNTAYLANLAYKAAVRGTRLPVRPTTIEDELESLRTLPFLWYQ